MNTTLFVQALVALAAIVGSVGGIAGVIAWRKSRGEIHAQAVDITQQLETYWAAAVVREEQVHRELSRVQDELALSRREASAAAAAAAAREAQLIERISELSDELQHARAEVASLRNELQTAREEVAQIAADQS